MLPTIKDYKLQEAIIDKIKNNNDNWQDMEQLIKSANIQAPLPIKLDGLLKYSNTINLSPLELVLTCASVKMATQFFNMCNDDLPLQEIYPANVKSLLHQESNAHSISSGYRSPDSYTNAEFMDVRLSSFFRSIRLNGNYVFDITSLIICNGRLMEDNDLIDYNNFWDSLDRFDIKITKDYKNLVLEVLNENLYNSYTKNFNLSLLNKCPNKWFEHNSSFIKEVNKKLSEIKRYYDQTYPDVESLIKEKMILCETNKIKKKQTQKTLKI